MATAAIEDMATCSRAARRRLQTRVRLLEAAREVVARKGIDAATIADITGAADVATGSFYNHFDSKDDLIDTLVAHAIDTHGHALDRLVALVADPAEVFAICVRHTLRMADRDPVWAWFTISAGLYLRELESGLGSRLLRDLQRGIESGRFTPGDTSAALVVVGGAVVAAMQGRLLAIPDIPPDEHIAEQLLRMLGLPAEEARHIASRPLDEFAACEQGAD